MKSRSRFSAGKRAGVGLLLLPLGCFLTQGSLLAGSVQLVRGRRAALTATATNLGLNPLQLIDPGKFDRQIRDAEKVRRDKAMGALAKSSRPAWMNEEVAAIRRGQAPHTLSGFLRDAAEGRARNAADLPPEARALQDRFRKIADRFGGSARSSERPPPVRRVADLNADLRVAKPRLASGAADGLRMDGDSARLRGQLGTRARQDAVRLHLSGSTALGGTTAADTAPTVDAPSDHATIAAKAAALGGDPVRIFNFVRDQITTELYLGSKKGALGTLREGAGNDYDQASLLVALLRAAGIPARYELGVVGLSREQVEHYTGVNGLVPARGFLATAGIGNALFELGPGRGQGVSVEHVWVRAFVSSTNYRGVNRPGTEGDWLPLSPSIKNFTRPAPVDLRDAVAFDFNTYLATPTTQRPSEAFAEDVRGFVLANGIDCTTLDLAQPQRQVVPVSAGILPSDLPARRLSSAAIVSELPAASRQSVNVTLRRGSGAVDATYAAPMAALWGKSLTVVYLPASAADAQTLADAGGIEDVAAYLVNMRPVLQVDGATVATGEPVMLGARQSLSLTAGGGEADHMLTVGGIYAFTLDPGLVPADLVTERQARLAGLTGDPRQAELLHVTALSYFRDLGLARRQIAGLHWHRLYKDIEEAQAAIEPRVTTFSGVPFSLARDFFQFDAALIRSGQYSVDGDNHRRVQVARLVGFESSFLEHKVGEIFWGPRQYSSVKLLQMANQAAVSVLTFSQSNLIEALEQIQWPAEFEESLASAANRGETIIAPVTGQVVAGFGALYPFIGTDPDSGAGEYIVAFDVGSATGFGNGGSGDAGGAGGGDPEPGCMSCGGSGAAASSVHLASGNYVNQETDLTLPARGIPLSFTRTYSTRLGWHHNYGQRIAPNTDGSLNWIDETGVPRRFTASGSGLWTPPPTFFQTISFNGTHYLMQFPDGLRYQFDAAGKLISQRDLNNNQVTLTYDGANRLSTVVGHGGSGFALVHDGLGRLQSVTDTAGRAVSFEYAAGPQIVAEHDVLNRLRTYSYDFAGRMIQKTDHAGNPTTMAYDDRDRIVRVVDREGGIFSYAYDASTRRTVATSRTGDVMIYELDANARPTRTVDAVGNEQVMTYDAFGNKTSERDGRGHTTAMNYDASGNLLTRLDPAGKSTIFTYGAHSRLETTTDAEGAVTTNFYDANGNLLATQDPALAVTNYSYDGSGLPLSITRPGGATTLMTYDPVGNVATMTDPEGGLTVLNYDTAGHLTAMQDPNLGVRTMVVDAAGQMQQMHDPENRITAFTYDDEGNRLTVTDPGNQTTTFTYDKLDRLLTTTDALGNLTRQQYDAEGRVVSRTNARGFTTIMRYDPIGRLASTVDAAGNETRMGYCADLSQSPCQTIDALGNVTSITDDEFGREVARTDPLGNVTATVYDELGRRSAVQDPAGNTTGFSYDELGRLTGVTDALLGLTTYSYDARGNRIGVADANGNPTLFDYDLANRLVRETTPINTVTEFGYDDAGNRTSKRDGKNQTTGFTYDLSRRLSAIAYASGAPAAFGYDNRGNKLTEGNGDSHRAMTYDALGRVATVLDQETGRTITYGYDPNGNRTSMHVAPDDETTRYEWDARDLLVRMVDPEGGEYLFAYDALGRRTRTVYPNRMTLLTSYDAASRVTAMIYRDRTGAVIESFTYTYDSRGNRTLKIFADSSSERYAYDALSRLVSVTYPSGRSVRYDYDAVGNRMRMAEGTASANSPATACVADQDCDGVLDAADNCPAVANPSQTDSDRANFPSGLVAGWRFEDPPGSFAVADVTGQHDGTRVGAHNIPDGRFGRAVTLGGGSPHNKIIAPSGPALEEIDKEMTVSAWVRPGVQGGSIVAKIGSFQFGIGKLSSGDQWIFAGVGPGVGGANSVFAPMIPDGQWTNVAAVTTVDHFIFYVNGLEVSRALRSFYLMPASVPSSNARVVLGCGQDFGGSECQASAFVGDLDEIAIFNRALTPAEVLLLTQVPVVGADGLGDACDACPHDADPTCAPVTCLDRDGDGYGVQGASACGAGQATALDCNDNAHATYPGALELCDSADNDCDGRVDDGCLADVVTTAYTYNGFNQLVSSGREAICAAGDGDCDGVANGADNCPLKYNPAQTDSDRALLDPSELGAVAAWDFNNVVGTSVPAVVGGYDGTIVGSDISVVAGRSGAGNALAFGDGTGSYLDVASTAINAALAATGAATVEAWVYVNPGATTAEKYIASSGTAFTALTMYFNVFSSGRGFNSVFGAVTAPQGQWVHVAEIITSDNQRRIFQNGVQINSGAVPSTEFQNVGWTFGGAAGFPNWPGMIDDVAIYPRVLTNSELVARLASRDNVGDACDPCMADANPTCVPASCVDADGDGFGVAGASACAGGTGNFDCDDNDEQVNPGMADAAGVVGDAIDNDCNGVIDGRYLAGNGSARYTYDGNGNQIEKRTYGPASVTTYEWSARDRLAKVREGGTVVAEYGYDTQNLRVMMREGGGERRILLDGIEEMAEYDALGAGERVARYDHDLMRVDALLAQVTGTVASPTKVHAFTDGLGSVYGVADSTGTLAGVQSRYSYDVYGARTGGSETPWGFTGRRGDATGLQHSRLRNYDDATGRFVAQDPAADVDGPNRYRYAISNPTNFRDPLGLCVDPGGSGPRICIDTFIPDKYFNKLTGHGDNRGPLSSGGSFRTRQLIRSRGPSPRHWFEFSAEASVSYSTLAPGGLMGSLQDHGAYQYGDNLDVRISAMNGFDSTDLGFVGNTMNSMIGGFGALGYDLTINVSSIERAQCGPAVISGLRTLFPAFEIWLYDDYGSTLLYYYDPRRYGHSVNELELGLVDMRTR